MTQPKRRFTVEEQVAMVRMHLKDKLLVRSSVGPERKNFESVQ